MPDYTSRSLPPTVPIRGLRPVHDFLSVQFDRDGLVHYGYILGKPLVVLRDSLNVLCPDIFHVIKATGLDGIPMGVVHLHFETFARRALILELGVEVNASVRAWTGHNVHHQLEILEIVVVYGPIIKRVSDRAVRDQRPVFDLERGLIAADFPARTQSGNRLRIGLLEYTNTPCLAISVRITSYPRSSAAPRC